MLPISQSYKIKLEGKFELGTQVNKMLKDLTNKMTARGGPLELLSINGVAPKLNKLFQYTKTEDKDNVPRVQSNDEPVLQEFLNTNGEKVHIYGVHHTSGKNDEMGPSNIVVRKRRRRSNGYILII